MNHDSRRLGIPSRFRLFGTRSNGAAVDFGSAIRPIDEEWKDPTLDFLLDQQVRVADTKAKTVKQITADWERTAKTARQPGASSLTGWPTDSQARTPGNEVAPHRTLFEVAEVIVAAGEMEAAIARMKMNERGKKCRAKVKEGNK